MSGLDLAGVLRKHYARNGFAPRAGWFTDPTPQRLGHWECSCGASGPVERGQRVVDLHRAHVAEVLAAGVFGRESIARTLFKVDFPSWWWSDREALIEARSPDEATRNDYRDRADQFLGFLGRDG